MITTPIISVFISCPADLAAEREIVKDIISQISTSQPQNKLVPYEYFDVELTADGHEPLVIPGKYLLPIEKTDIFICMLWNSIGTSTDSVSNPATNEPYHGRTEYELLTASESFQKNGNPKILLYRCTRPQGTRTIGKAQKKIVDQLFDELKHLFSSQFSNEGDFREILQRDLRNLLKKDRAMLPTQENLEADIHQIIDGIRGISIDTIDNRVLLPRDILIFSWLLQRRQGSIERKKLTQLIGMSQAESIDALLWGIFFPRKFFEQITNEYIILTDNAMAAFQNVFSASDLYYLIMEPVGCFDHYKIKGFEFLEYFSMIAESPVPLQEMVRRAFSQVLHDVQMQDKGRGVYLVSKPKVWEKGFILFVRPNVGAIGSNDLFRIAFDLGNIRDRETIDWHILLMAPNSENIEVYKDAESFNLLHHVWSSSALRLFNRLKHISDSYGSEAMTKEFHIIFPPPGSSFSAMEALDKLEERLR